MTSGLYSWQTLLRTCDCPSIPNPWPSFPTPLCPWLASPQPSWESRCPSATLPSVPGDLITVTPGRTRAQSSACPNKPQHMKLPYILSASHGLWGNWGWDTFSSLLLCLKNETAISILLSLPHAAFRLSEWHLASRILDGREKGPLLLMDAKIFWKSLFS